MFERGEPAEPHPSIFAAEPLSRRRLCKVAAGRDCCRAPRAVESRGSVWTLARSHVRSSAASGGPTARNDQVVGTRVEEMTVAPFCSGPARPPRRARCAGRHDAHGDALLRLTSRGEWRGVLLDSTMRVPSISQPSELERSALERAAAQQPVGSTPFHARASTSPGSALRIARRVRSRVAHWTRAKLRSRPETVRKAAGVVCS